MYQHSKQLSRFLQVPGTSERLLIVSLDCCLLVPGTCTPGLLPLKNSEETLNPSVLAFPLVYPKDENYVPSSNNFFPTSTCSVLTACTMALVQYSDSESDTDQNTPPRKLNKLCQGASSGDRPASSLPPLPASFHDLYASSIRVSVRDDPSLHGGRKRVVPHIEGNWPTHVYLEWYPSKEELRLLDDIITQAERMLTGKQSKLHSLLRSDLGVQLPLHISLSRPVVLRTEQRQPFMDTFQVALQNSDMSAFDVKMESLDWVSNSEKTRWFYVLRVRRRDGDCLNRLLRITNRSLDLFGQPPLYESAMDPSRAGESQRHAQGRRTDSPTDYMECFHVSIAWSLEQPLAEDRERMESIDLQALNYLRIPFDCVKAKIGNHVSSIPLSS